jgi:outer membrane cobalamin receptor
MSGDRVLTRVFGVLAIAWLLPAFASAQSTSVEGRVADPQGGTINGATVTVTSSSGGGAKTTRTGVDGTFSIENVAPGAATLEIDAAGFDHATQSVTVAPAMAPLSIVLQIAGVVESVGVVAPKLEEELPQIIERGGVRAQTITAAEIQNGGYYDVAQALQALVPGLFLTPKAGPFDYVTASFQGSRTNEILWLVDGVRISNRLYNGTTPLDTIPAHMVERIEILEGGQGLFYGTQAVAGVINVVTRAFTDRPNATLQGGGNTNDGGFGSALARGSAGGNRFVLYGSTDDAKGFQPFPSAQYQASTSDRNRSYDVHSFGGKYAYDFSKQVRFTAAYQFTNAVRLDNLAAARSGTFQTGGIANAFNERNEHIFSTKVDVSPSDTFQVFFKGYYHRWDSHYNEVRNVIGSPGASDVVSDHEFWGYKDYGANLLAKFTPTKAVEYYAGYDFQNYSGEDAVLLIAPNTERVHAVFGQVQTTRDLIRNVTLTAGVRYNAPSAGESRAVWNVTGRYDFAGSLFAGATVGTSFRYPDAYELFAVDPTCCVGNPNLKPESSTNFNASIGGRVQTGPTTVDLEVIGFYRKVSNLIVDVDDGTGSGNTVTANSENDVRVHGFSLVGSASLTSAVAASLGYTYTTSEQGNQLAGGYSSLPGLPANRFNSSVDLHPARTPVGGTLTVFWVGEIFDNVSTFGRVPSGNYAVVDLSGRYFLDQHRRHRVNLRLENLFNKEYATGHGRAFPDAGTQPYLVSTLGVPRTLHVSYTFSY